MLLNPAAPRGGMSALPSAPSGGLDARLLDPVTVVFCMVEGGRNYHSAKYRRDINMELLPIMRSILCQVGATESSIRRKVGRAFILYLYAQLGGVDPRL